MPKTLQIAKTRPFFSHPLFVPVTVLPKMGVSLTVIDPADCEELERILSTKVDFALRLFQFFSTKCTVQASSRLNFLPFRRKQRFSSPSRLQILLLVSSIPKGLLLCASKCPHFQIQKVYKSKSVQKSCFDSLNMPDCCSHFTLAFLVHCILLRVYAPPRLTDCSGISQKI
jgi:hypothetical protein